MVSEGTRIFAPVVDGPGVRQLTLVSPNRWKGETDCLVGPFSHLSLAHGFANLTTDFGQYGGVRFHVFVKGDSWYVEVQRQA